MFNRKKIAQEVPNTVKCEACKHLVGIGDAQRIEVVNAKAGSIILYDGIKRLPSEEFYCPQHKKYYQRVYIDYSAMPHYYREFEVDEEGKLR